MASKQKLGQKASQVLNTAIGKINTSKQF